MNNNKDKALFEKRQVSAFTSKGISSEHIYSLFIKEIKNSRLAGSILDYGSGVGLLTDLLLETHNFTLITAADLFDCPKHLEGEVAWIKGDLNNAIGINDSSFDVIVSSEVIEHLENPRFIAREWFRLLKPGGILLFSTPNNDSLRA